LVFIGVMGILRKNEKNNFLDGGLTDFDEKKYAVEFNEMMFKKKIEEQFRLIEFIFKNC